MSTHGVVVVLALERGERREAGDCEHDCQAGNSEADLEAQAVQQGLSMTEVKDWLGI